MLSWSRPDPLTRDLVHLINARRHDHGDTDSAIDTLQAFLEQGREYDLLTVLAALDEDMAEWLFDLLAEASCAVILDGPADAKLSYAIMAALELPLQANLAHPLKLKIDPVATAELLHRHLRLSAGTVVRVESRLLTDSTLEPLSLQGLNEHLSTVADSQRTTSIAARLYPPVENTAFLFFELIGVPDSGLPDSLEDRHRRALLEGLVAECPELALAPDMIEAPVYAAYAMFDAQNAVRLHRLADETAAVWRDLDPLVRARTIVHLHRHPVPHQC